MFTLLFRIMLEDLSSIYSLLSTFYWKRNLLTPSLQTPRALWAKTSCFDKKSTSRLVYELLLWLLISLCSFPTRKCMDSFVARFKLTLDQPYSILLYLPFNIVIRTEELISDVDLRVSPNQKIGDVRVKFHNICILCSLTL